MSQLTMIGYIIAAFAIVFGLYLIFRKNTSAEQNNSLDATAALTAASLEAGRIPVVPRHAREHLEPLVEAPLAAPVEEAVLEQASLIKPGVAREQYVADEISMAGVLEQAEIATSTATLQETVVTVAHDDDLDRALAELDAATNPDAPVAQEVPVVASVTQEPVIAAPEAVMPTLNSQVEAASVSEWQGESALLDAHIEDQSSRDDESALAKAEHILALYVMPPANRVLAGERALQLLRQFGLRYGEMALFHRYQDGEGTGPLMFSVLRYTSEGPSGFDLETLSNEQVEGLAFFLALPGKHAVAGYDMMVSISGLLAREVGGRVYDEHMNELTPQLREHYRHFVLDYRSQQM